MEWLFPRVIQYKLERVSRELCHFCVVLRISGKEIVQITYMNVHRVFHVIYNVAGLMLFEHLTDFRRSQKLTKFIFKVLNIDLVCHLFHYTNCAILSCIMPRLTHDTYTDQRERLCEVWNFIEREFALLKPHEQWDLHRFYAISEDMTDAELRLHRRLVKQVDPSLPQRAGRAYAKLQRGDWSQAVTVSMTKGRTLTVRSIVKPKPDPRQYARALIQLSMEPPGSNPNLDAAGVGRLAFEVRRQRSCGRH
jgi:hypothetical protein